MNEKEIKLHLNLSKFFEPIDSNPTLEQGTEIMNYYNDCVDRKVHPKEFEANLNPCLIKGDRVHAILTYQLGYLSAVDLDKYKIMYDKNGENHYDMIKRDDAKNLENYNYIKNQILKY